MRPICPTFFVCPTPVRRRMPFALGALAASLAACGSHDGAHDARDAEREEIRAAARQAAALATGDSTALRTTQDREAKSRLSLHVGSGDLVRGADPPLGAGDVRVTSIDGVLVLALIGDTVRVRPGDSLAVLVRQEMAKEADTVSGFGGFVARTVTGAVGGAMSEATRFAVRVPVTQVRDLRYENGHLRFETGSGRRYDRDRARRRDGKHHDDGTGARFSPADAERFIAAVRARQRALGVGS